VFDSEERVNWLVTVIKRGWWLGEAEGCGPTRRHPGSIVPLHHLNLTIYTLRYTTEPYHSAQSHSPSSQFIHLLVNVAQSGKMTSTSNNGLPPNVHISSHPCIRSKLSQLRSLSTNARDFKSLVQEIATMVACEAFGTVFEAVDAGTVSVFPVYLHWLCIRAGHRVDFAKLELG
jgi:Uracil phosphoribosyltransferase